MKFRIPLTLRKILEQKYPELNWNIEQGACYGFVKWLVKSTLQELEVQGLIFEAKLDRYELALIMLRELPDTEGNRDFIADIELKLKRERLASAVEQRVTGALVVNPFAEPTISKDLSGEVLVQACQQALEFHFAVQPMAPNVPPEVEVEIFKQLSIQALTVARQVSHYWNRLGHDVEVQTAILKNKHDNSPGKELRRYLLVKQADQIWKEYCEHVLAFNLAYLSEERKLSASMFFGLTNDVAYYTVLGFSYPYKDHSCFIKFLSAQYITGQTSEERKDSFKKLIANVMQVSSLQFSDVCGENDEINFAKLLRKNRNNYFGIANWLMQTSALEGLLAFLMFMRYRFLFCSDNIEAVLTLLNSPLKSYLTREGLVLLVFHDKGILTTMARLWLAEHVQPNNIQSLLDKLTNEDWFYYFSGRDSNSINIIELIRESNGYCLQRFDENLLLKFVEILKTNIWGRQRLVAAILGSQFCEKISDENLVKLARYLKGSSNAADDVLSQAVANPRFMARMTGEMWLLASDNNGNDLLQKNDLFNNKTTSLGVIEKMVSQMMPEELKRVQESMRALKEEYEAIGRLKKLKNQRENAEQLLLCLKYYVKDSEQQTVMQADLGNPENLDNCLPRYLEQLIACVLNNSNTDDNAFWAHYRDLWLLIRDLDAGVYRKYLAAICFGLVSFVPAQWQYITELMQASPEKREDIKQNEDLLELVKCQAIVEKLDAQGILTLAKRSLEVATILLNYPFVQEKLSLREIMDFQHAMRKRFPDCSAIDSELDRLKAKKEKELLKSNFLETLQDISALPENYRAIRLYAQSLQDNEEALTEQKLKQLKSEVYFLIRNKSKVEEQQRIVAKMLVRLKAYGEKFFEVMETYEEGGQHKSRPEFFAKRKGEAVLSLHQRLTEATRVHYSDPSAAAFGRQSIQSVWIRETESALNECGSHLKLHRNGLLELVQLVLLNAVSVLLAGIPWLVNKAVTGNFFMRVQSQTEKQLISMNARLQAGLDERQELVEAYKALGAAKADGVGIGSKYLSRSERRQLHEKIDVLEQRKQERKEELKVQPDSEKIFSLKLKMRKCLSAEALDAYQSGKREYNSSKKSPPEFRW